MEEKTIHLPALVVELDEAGVREVVEGRPEALADAVLEALRADPSVRRHLPAAGAAETGG